LHIDRRTYASWEQGTQDIKSTFIPQLADFFGVEITELFNEDKGIQISQTFENSTINTAILILTDKAAIDRVLDAIKYIDKK
jgi:transcriptional regulator with XRE-family HTH domain